MTDTRVNVSRPDGRPEAYDVPKNFAASCAMCVEEGHTAKLGYGKLVMCSPIDSSDGQAHLVCVEKHTPANIVIFDPATGLCRDKTGQNVWREDTPGVMVPYTGKQETEH
jgi:hypothetical protein